MPTRYCCCFAVRHVLIWMSTILLLASGLLASTIWWIVSQEHDAQVPSLSHGVKSAYIATGVFSSSLVIVSLLGLIGAVRRNFALISIYYCCLWVSLLAMTGLGAYHLDIIIRNIDSARVPRAMYVTAFIMVFVFLLVGAIAAYQFGTELWEDIYNNKPRSAEGSPELQTLQRRRPLLRIVIPSSTHTQYNYYP